MNKYSAWQAPIWSFFSAALYRDVGQQWRGGGILYLLCLIAASCIVSGVQNFQGVLDLYHSCSREIVEQFPALTITGGELSIDKPCPHCIYDPRSGQALVIFDTTGEVTELANTSAQYLLTKTSLLGKSRLNSDSQASEEENAAAASDVKYLEFSVLGNFKMGPQDLAKLLSACVFVIPGLMYLSSVVFAFGWQLLQVIVYAFVGLVVAKTIGVKIGYLQSFRLAAVATGPAVIFEAVYQASGVYIPFWPLFRVVAVLGYVGFAVGANLSSAQAQDGSGSGGDVDYRDLRRQIGRRRFPGSPPDA